VTFGSYGTHVLIFALQGGSEVRKTALGADSQIEAAQTLEGMSDEALAEEFVALVPCTRNRRSASGEALAEGPRERRPRRESMRYAG
ncbi:hypothetical protein, partial [Sediminicurvatus halobius]